MSYGSNPYRKDNPRRVIGNATETPMVPDSVLRLLAPTGGLRDYPVSGSRGSVVSRFRDACGICVAWLIGLPRRAGARLYSMSDAEARWWYWQVTERGGGLVRQYRDERFQGLRRDPSVRRAEPGADLADAGLASPDHPCPGKH